MNWSDITEKIRSYCGVSAENFTAYYSADAQTTATDILTDMYSSGLADRDFITFAHYPPENKATTSAIKKDGAYVGNCEFYAESARYLKFTYAGECSITATSSDGAIALPSATLNGGSEFTEIFWDLEQEYNEVTITFTNIGSVFAIRDLGLYIYKPLTENNTYDMRTYTNGAFLSFGDDCLIKRNGKEVPENEYEINGSLLKLEKSGVYDVYYYPNGNIFNFSESDPTSDPTIDITEDIATVLAVGIASRIFWDDFPEKGTYLKNEYEIGKERIKSNHSNKAESIRSVYWR